jgi:FKBP-type peptidyl-prolyl cis-trans isomerase FkpA
MRRIIAVAGILFTVSLVSCFSDHPGYKKSDSGLYSRFHEQNGQGEQVKTGDEVTVAMRLYTKDSVFLETGRDTMLSDKILIEESVYPGDVYEALMMMKTGDSATFILRGPELFLTFFRMQELPEYARDSTEVWMDVRLRERLSKEDYERQLQAMEESRQKMLDELQRSEPDRISAFLKESRQSAKPRPSGLYYIEVRKGQGTAISNGSEVTLNYVAKLTNGKIIETSLKEEAMKSGIFDSLFEYTPFTFIMGDKSTVPGWEEGISCMRKGGRAVIVVPSSLAYGEEGLEDLIPPYSPVIYEIEILDVK